MKLVLPLLIFSSLCLGCNIQIDSFILKLSKNLDDSTIIKSDCDSKIKAKFITAINSIDGKVHARSIAEMMNQPQITISPKRVEITSLERFLNNHFNSKDYKISNLNSITSKRFLGSNSFKDINVSCNDCSNSGHKSVKIANKSDKIWLSAKFTKSKQVAVLKNDFRQLGSSITKDDIEIKRVFTQTNQNLFFDYDNIQYYKINKFIPKGHVLKTYDLSAINLITLGKTVDLIVKSDNISLRTKATARQSAAYGSDVELINLKTKKRVLAKVTGKNQATVSL